MGRLTITVFEISKNLNKSLNFTICQGQQIPRVVKKLEKTNFQYFPLMFLSFFVILLIFGVYKLNSKIITIQKQNQQINLKQQEALKEYKFDIQFNIQDMKKMILGKYENLNSTQLELFNKVNDTLQNDQKQQEEKFGNFEVKMNSLEDRIDNIENIIEQEYQRIQKKQFQDEQNLLFQKKQLANFLLPTTKKFTNYNGIINITTIENTGKRIYLSVLVSGPGDKYFSLAPFPNDGIFRLIINLKKLPGWITYGIAPVNYLEQVNFLQKQVWTKMKEEMTEIYGFASHSAYFFNMNQHISKENSKIGDKITLQISTNDVNPKFSGLHDVFDQIHIKKDVEYQFFASFGGYKDSKKIYELEFIIEKLEEKLQK